MEHSTQDLPDLSGAVLLSTEEMSRHLGSIQGSLDRLEEMNQHLDSILGSLDRLIATTGRILGRSNPTVGYGESGTRLHIRLREPEGPFRSWSQF